MVRYCDENKQLLVQLFDMNFQPANPGDWFHYFDRCQRKSQLIFYMKQRLNNRPWFERLLLRMENKVNF